MSLLAQERWSMYLKSKPASANRFIHTALVREVSYPDHTPGLQHSNSIRNGLFNIIKARYTRDTTVERLHGDDPSTLASNKNREAAIYAAAKDVLKMVESIYNMNLQSTQRSSASSSSSSSSPMSYTLSEYRHLSAHLALDVLIHFGMFQLKTNPCIFFKIYAYKNAC